MPISLGGGLYKFRLKKVIKQVILRVQNGFFEDRHIPNACTCNKTKDFAKKSLKMHEFSYPYNTRISTNLTNKDVYGKYTKVVIPTMSNRLHLSTFQLHIHQNRATIAWSILKTLPTRSTKIYINKSWLRINYTININKIFTRSLE